MSNYHLAEINIAKMKGVDINDPIMKEFVDNLDLVNNLLSLQLENNYKIFFATNYTNFH